MEGSRKSSVKRLLGDQKEKREGLVAMKEKVFEVEKTGEQVMGEMV